MDIKKDIKYAQSQFCIEKLRKHQVKPINSILAGKDTMVIAPTSAGKSAIYQIPALLFNGITLVIEPTLSLMYDQVNKLKSHGIHAVRIDSSVPAREKGHILGCIKTGKIKILFVTPERLQNQKFQDAIKDVRISLIVIDECHCVTSWGYGFRDDYLRIGKFVDTLNHNPVIVALTATATPDMRLKICDLLSMDQPEMFKSSLYRPNLHFMKRLFVSDEAKLKELKRLLKKRKGNCSCIIYCNTKKMTDAVYDEVKKWYPGDIVKCHSNLTGKVRKRNELLFLNGEKRIMVASSAFGLGIDQSNVDLVIHFNLPLSLLDYYQQAGRAGRAGQKSKCILLYCENDYFVNRTILREIDDNAARKNVLRALDEMKEYAESYKCLTRQILSALGEKLDKPCGSCTNCQRKKRK